MTFVYSVYVQRYSILFGIGNNPVIFDVMIANGDVVLSLHPANLCLYILEIQSVSIQKRCVVAQNPDRRYSAQTTK